MRHVSFLALLVNLACLESAIAGDTFARNNSWPDPFICRDRELVSGPLQATVANGWKRQCLLQAYHFDETSQLTQAGQRKLEWVLTQAPVQRRALFVQRSQNPEVTAARVETVTRAASRLSNASQVPQIVETDRVDEGWPAQEVDDVAKAYQKTTPDPRLRPASSASPSGSGSSK
jgi:hypothetical protein